MSEDWTKDRKGGVRDWRIAGVCLLASFLAFLFVATAAASDDLSGRWKIVYAIESGSPDDGLAEGSVARWSEKDSTLQGRATQGNRGDGYLIGYCMESFFRAAITFRHNPTMFVQLTGSRTDGELLGSFTASSSKGGFWKWTLRDIQLTTGTGDVITPDTGSDPGSFTPTDVDLLPEPTWTRED